MRYFVPSLQLGVLLPPQTRLEEKLGGLPWGLPVEQWPLCSECGGPQSMIAQLVHDPERLDLGAAGRTLLVFQCNHAPGACETWAGGSGANACLVLEAAELRGELTPVPEGTEVETEARITGWTAHDDGVSPQLFPSFFDDSALAKVPSAVASALPENTRLGGTPTWIQGASEGPKAPWRFALQLDCLHRFAGAAPSADELGCTVTREVNGEQVSQEPSRTKPGAPPWVTEDESGYFCGAANFGDAGMAYVFVRTDTRRPQGWFFWQCG